MSLQFYDGSQFWKSPSEYKPGQRVTEEKRTEIESLLNVELPATYIQLMEQQNGGELLYRYVLFEDGDAAIIPYFHELELKSGVGLSSVFIEELGLPNDLIMLTGDFHSWLALDYRHGKKEPSVLYLSEDDPASGVWNEHLIANTFDDFLKQLFKKEG
ncbi:hypothetical protein JCM9140_1643 [Halalkalibacter wakoensis JCM 9140]|uniref:Knr4/Smi1-like domain-containing protein n=1 Tax=Halalkalibacter wakoensis JCM 9140 TaxID=1236970 RepID=W4Q0M7_9BACI|nr:SMI1/KNR4 family protein [Halalkalibacter wakoensis]GAE25636.1 hypothetical protein JCM9140_1643 [Halalkalibacter wakoensis JCM 9140]